MAWLLRLDRTSRLIILSVLLGVVGALGAQIFLWMLHMGEALLINPIAGYHFLKVSEAVSDTVAPPQHWFWLIPLVTTFGGLISGVLVYSLAPEAEGHGTDAAVKAFHHLNGRVRARIPLIKSVASAITIGSGGAAGREGPTAQIAAGIGAIVGEVLRLPDDERRYLVLVGMAAGLSAIFKSPLGTAIFAVEILYSTMAFEGGALIFTIIGAATAYALTGMVDGWTPLFYLVGATGHLTLSDLVWYAILGVAAGSIGALLPSVFYSMRDWFKAIPIPNHFKPAIGGLILGLIGISLPQLLGGGYGWIQMAISGKLAISLMLLLALGKIVALSLTIGSGGSGGVFAPSLYIGAMVGGSLAAILHAIAPGAPNLTAFAMVGMAATFAGAARVPIATLLMVAEMTNGYQLILPAMVAVVIAFMVQEHLVRWTHAKYASLYEAQVPRPSDSPVHRNRYYQAVAGMLRQRKVRLEEDLVRQELADRLNQGESIPLVESSCGHEYLYSVQLGKHSIYVGRSLANCALSKDILVVSILRDQEAIMPHGDTVLESGDKLMIAATSEALEHFKKLATGEVGS